MNIYIVMIFVNDSLDFSFFETFMSLTEAQALVKEYLRIKGIPQDCDITYDNYLPDINGWQICNCYWGFNYKTIFIMERQLKTFASASNKILSYKELNDLISGSKSNVIDDPFDTSVKIDVSTSVSTLPPSIPDNPADPSLPGGFRTYDNKPLTIQDVIDVSDVHPIHSLSEHQKWALTIARINKRAGFSTIINGIPYDQLKALNELKNKSTVGLLIRNVELDWIQTFYYSLDHGAKFSDLSEDESSSWDYY